MQLCLNADFQNWMMNECAKRGWDLAELEKVAGIRKGTIESWEKSYPHEKYLIKIASAFGKSYAWVEENVYSREYKSRWDIYIIICKETNRIYVGRTNAAGYRYEKHLSALRHNRHYVKLMQTDFNKYGEDSFEYVVLLRDVSGRREKEYMERFETYNPAKGYNYLDQTTGGKMSRKDRIHEIAMKYGVSESEL